MSSSIAIPGAGLNSPVLHFVPRESGKATISSTSSCSSTPGTPELAKATTPTSEEKMLHQRRPSLLSTALSQQECTTIDIADDSEGPVRLISYLSSSQGFAWNPEIFLPSYVDHDYVPLENRRDPVHEIVLSDEEAKKMLP